MLHDAPTASRIVQGIRQGDIAAAELLYAAVLDYRPLAAKLLRNMGFPADMVDDVLQDSWIRAAKYLTKHELHSGDGCLWHVLRQIVRMVILACQENETRAFHRFNSSPAPIWSRWHTAECVNLVEQERITMVLPTAMNCLARLSRRRRELLTAIFRGEDRQHTKEWLGLTESQYRTLKWNAVQKLKQTVQRQMAANEFICEIRRQLAAQRMEL